MDKKLGIYICGGCGIGEVVDTPQIAKTVGDSAKGAVCRIHPHLCGSEGIGLIRQDLAAGAVTLPVIAACSPRMKTDIFALGDRIVPERVNLRELVAWCHKPQDEDTQMLAEDYLRMGIVKAQKTEPLEPLAETISRKLLVVGGGITGITAALEAAEAGYEVVLVEKQAHLGGFVSTLKKRFPTAPPYTELINDGIAGRIEAATYHPNIQVLTSTTIVRIEGQPGMFDVILRNEAGECARRVGAMVMATGWKPYDTTRLGHLGYGLTPDVMTSVELEKMAAQGSIVRPSDGRPVESVLFIQCAGSRDKEHLPYCSSVCCMATLKHATYVREQNPNAQVYVVYKDIRTPGQYERFYATVQNHPLNFLTQGEVTAVEKAASGKLAVTVKNSLLGEAVVLHVDLVVLATGMVANSADGEAIRALEDAERVVAKGESEEPTGGGGTKGRGTGKAQRHRDLEPDLPAGT